MTETHDQIARVVRHFLTANGLRQSDLADSAGFSLTALNLRLHGHVKWTDRDIDKLKRAGVPLPNLDQHIGTLVESSPRSRKVPE